MSDNEILHATKLSFRGISTNMLFKILGFGFAFFFQVYYARILGPMNLGDLGLAMVVISIGSILGNLGLDTSLTRFSSGQVLSEESKRKLTAYLGFALQASFLVSLPLALIAYFFRHEIAGWISPSSDISSYIAMIAPLLLITGMSMQLGGALRASEKFESYSFSNDFIPRFLLGFLFLVINVLFGLEVIAYIVAFIIGTVLSFALKLYFLRRQVFGRSLLMRAQIEKREKREFLIFALKTLIYVSLVTMMAQTARLLMGVFGQNTNVGIYAVVESLSVILMFLQGSVGTVFTPQISRLHVEGKTEVLHALYKRLSRWSLVACIPYSVVLMMDSKEVMSLYGPGFVSGGDALIVLIVAQVLVVVLGLNGNLLYMTGNENTVLGAQVVCLIATVISGLLLVPRYGAVGAAFAAGSSMVLMNLILLFVVARRFHIWQFSTESFKTLMAVLILVPFVWFSNLYLKLGFVAGNILAKIVLSYVLFAGLIYMVDKREEDVQMYRAAAYWIKQRALRLSE